MKKITTALLSVSDKSGIVEFAAHLTAMGVRLLSTGGTAKLLKEQGIAVSDVSDITGFPEIMDGRVKTLHPKIHGGILARRDDANHLEAMREHGIGAIDLVAINLYPFEETVASGAGFDEVIEQIDIGGPAMIRAAAKNHHDVTVLVDSADYAEVLSELAAQDSQVSAPLRKRLAGKAYARTAAYDSAVAAWFTGQQEASEGEAFGARYQLSAERVQALRYGENPHQQAAFYRMGPSAGTLAGAVQLQGKELSYNNLNDTDAAIQLIADLAGPASSGKKPSDSKPAVAIIKHANPCGVALGETLLDAYHRAFACDPKSAFGGIIACSHAVDKATAEAISQQFAEVIVAPAFDEDARAVFAAKKNLRLLETGPYVQVSLPMVKTVSGGLLVQSADAVILDEATLTTVTKRAPTAQEMADLRLAFALCKHVKSNAIVLVKDGRTHGIGAGQMSRVDSVHIACKKAEENGLGTQGCVMASDAFFPFDDNVHAAAQAGVTALIQPGGSVRDDEVIAAADQHGMAMVTTGIRHFRH